MFKEGWALRHLQKQWPLGMLQNRLNGLSYIGSNSCWIHGETLLENGRFTFQIDTSWGDLRKLIELRMQHYHNQSPPSTMREVKPISTMREVKPILLDIAIGMEALHKRKIIHETSKFQMSSFGLKTSRTLIRFIVSFCGVQSTTTLHNLM